MKTRYWRSQYGQYTGKARSQILARKNDTGWLYTFADCAQCVTLDDVRLRAGNYNIHLAWINITQRQYHRRRNKWEKRFAAKIPGLGVAFGNVADIQTARFQP